MTTRSPPARHRHPAAWALALALLGAAAVGAAGPEAGVVVSVDADPPVRLTVAELSRLPAVTEDVAFATEHGSRHGRFEGPLLWSVLDHAHAVVPGKAGGQVRRLVVLTGGDGYAAVLAVGEISPDFEDKPVVLALRMDGAVLDHPRVVVPGDRHGGRGVHDVVRITVADAAGLEARHRTDLDAR